MSDFSRTGEEGGSSSSRLHGRLVVVVVLDVQILSLPVDTPPASERLPELLVADMVLCDPEMP